MSSASIVILNYNGRSFLEKFLPNVIKFSTPYDVIVADNASTDDSIEFINQHFREVRLIIIPKNEGFAGGYNIALSQIDSTYLVLINSDVEVREGWLPPLLTFLEKNAQYAACQPKIKSYNRPHLFEYAGAAGGFIDALGYPYCRGRLFDDLEEDHGQYDSTIDIFWASGACMVIRKTLFEASGGFDEDFFAHMEEIDLCWRLHRMGHKIACIHESEVYHVGGGTLSKSNPKKTYLNFRNGLSVITKNLPITQLIWKLPLRIGLDLVAAFVFLKTDSEAHFRAVLGAIRDYLLTLPITWNKRKKQHFPRDIDIRPHSIVFDFFIRRLRKYSDLKTTA